MKGKWLTALVLALATFTAQAGFPSWYPDNGFKHWGKIDSANIDKGTLVISDMFYHLSENVVVYSLSDKSDSVSRLRPGVTVGFVYDSNERNEWFIREIWLLPSNYSQPDR